METRGYALVAALLALWGLLGYNAIANDLTTRGLIVTGAVGVLGSATIIFAIVCEGIIVPARATAVIVMAGATALAGFGVYGDIYETTAPTITSAQRLADQAEAELYSTDSVTIIPDEGGHILFAQDSCLATSQLPAGVSLWNGERQPNGVISNTKGFCTLTIDRTGNYSRLLPTLNGANALHQIKHLPSDPSKLVVQFPVDVRMDVYVYNPEKARQQGATLMPNWVSNKGLCNGCSSAAAYTNSN